MFWVLLGLMLNGACAAAACAAMQHLGIMPMHYIPALPPSPTSAVQAGRLWPSMGFEGLPPPRAGAAEERLDAS